MQLGQTAKITIDAIPDTVVQGPRQRDRQQPDPGGAPAPTATQATNFKVVVILDEPVPEVRPGFTCTADITTATRKDVVAVPIPAVAVRELVYDANGQIVKEPRTDKRRADAGRNRSPSAAELKPGQTRKEVEGVFVVRDGRASSCRSRWASPATSISRCSAASRAGDQVITGPYNSVRGMADGDLVKVGQRAEEGK